MVYLTLYDCNFNIDEDGTIYRKDKRTNKYKLYNTNIFDKDGYCGDITIQNKTLGIYKKYRVHRLIYKAFNQDWDINNSKIIIDHIDRVRNNNHIVNLRQVTYRENMFNLSNVRGYKKRSNGRYQVEIRVDGKKKHICMCDTEEEAQQMYLKAKQVYHIIDTYNQ
tara:strand:- start:29 stop:523 length:495 start_codon:yes stop_codon:yes gene_type:complete